MAFGAKKVHKQWSSMPGMDSLKPLQPNVQGPLQAPAPAYRAAEPPVQNPKSDNAAETGQAQPKASRP